MLRNILIGSTISVAIGLGSMIGINSAMASHHTPAQRDREIAALSNRIIRLQHRYLILKKHVCQDHVAIRLFEGKGILASHPPIC